MRNILILVLTTLLMSCSMLSPLPIPNPLEAEKGINTNLALGKTVETNHTKGLVTLDKIDIARDSSTTSNNANTMTINSGMDRRMLILIICLVSLIVLLAGAAIPTRGQANRIKELKENLEYERTRTNITIEASAERQRSRLAQDTK